MNKEAYQLSETTYSKDHVALDTLATNQSTFNSNQSQVLNSQRDGSSRRKYGNMVVLFENDKWLITLGPDYICCIMAILCFIVLDYFTVRQILAKPDRQLWGAITMVGAVVQIFLYIIIAISNPGIITQADFDTQGQEQVSKIKRFCNICNLPMLPRSRHCSECGVCIKGYDHHCPWTSKCIGQHNLYRFYFFAFYTPAFIMYCIFVLSVFA